MNKVTIRNEETKKLLKTRINRISGQISGISNMIDENRYCDDILIQLSAINSAIKSVANVILESHMKNCVRNNIINGNDSIIDEFIEMVKRFQ